MTSPRRQSSNSGSRNRGGEAARTPTEAMPRSITIGIDVEPKLPLERIGDILRKAREARGDDLQNIADYLCIRRNLLVALEESKYDQFPADAYVIGFLRSYAELLGVDSREAIDRYRHEMAGRRKKPVLTLPTPISEGRAPTAIIMIGAAIVAIVIYAMWYGLSASDRTAVTTPPALPSTAATETPPSAAAIPATTTPASPAALALPNAVLPAAPALPTAVSPPVTNAATQTYGNAPLGSHITIRADQSSWILVLDSKGNTVFDHVLKPGDTYKVPNQDGLTFTTGNGSGVTIVLNGTDLPKLSTGSSHILRNIPLDSEHLRAMAASTNE